MTVKELIEKLNSFPQDKEVILEIEYVPRKIKDDVILGDVSSLYESGDYLYLSGNE